VAIINEYLARELFPDRDPVGQFLPGETPGKRTTVVGVVKNSWLARYDQPMDGEIYLPYRQVVRFTFASTIVVRTTGNLLPWLTQSARSCGRSTPISRS
jgi:hypothetical protein